MRARLRSAAGRLHRLALRGALRALAPRVAPGIPGAEVRRVLVSGSMGIGNAVMFEPLLHALRDRFPAAHLAAVVAADAPSRAILEWPGLVDEVIVVRGSSRLARAFAGFRLARQRWDLCVIRFNGATQEMVVAAIVGRIPYRVGHVTSGRFRSELDWLFNYPVTMGDSDHEVDRYLALAERTGQVPTRRAPSLTLAAADRASSQAILERLGVTPQSLLIAFQPGTSAHQLWKRWPSEHWRALARGLTAAGFAVIALGSADESNLLDEICRDTGAVNAAGACSLRQAAAILERSVLLVCTDSGLMHIAAAVGTPIVGIFGPTDQSRTRPYGAGHLALRPANCRGHRVPCLNLMGELSPECTWDACLRSIPPEEVQTRVLGLAASHVA
jgi:lipopolysaccharide heptosyltransferase II